MMIDPLAERFLTLADTDAHPDWRDVRRRAERPRALVFVVVIAVAAMLAAAALSAGQTWVFGTHWGQPTAYRTVTLHGEPYTVRLSLLDQDGHYFALLLAGSGGHTRELTAVYSGAMIGPRDRITAPTAVSEMNYRKDGGEIWYGDAVSRVRRVAIIDTHGRAHATDTVSGPNLPGHVRFWAVSIEHGFARTLVAYDGDGNVVQHERIFSMMRSG